MFWKRFGLLLQWVGVIYVVGFALLGIVMMLVYPRISQSFASSSQSAILGFSESVIIPLIVFFMVIGAACWYEGKELIGTSELNLFDKIVAVVLLLVLIVLATPQLVQGYASIVPYM